MERRSQVSPLALAAVAWALLVAARAFTLAPDPWEWDEILFVRAVLHGIDLRSGRPHAPGYPLFVQTARGLAALGFAPFHATVLVGFAGGVLAPAGLAALLAALELPLATSVFGAALYAFLPAVWLHGGRPLSDSPAAAAFLFSAAAFVAALRQENGRLLAAGAALAALCFGLRPQTAVALLPLAAVVAFRFLRRDRGRPVLTALALGLGFSALAYAPAIRGSGGWASFRGKVAAQVAYVGAVDALTRADLARAQTWTRWFRDPFGPDAIAIAFGVLAFAALAFSFRKALALVALFLPLYALTIPFSTLQAAPRYAVSLLPLPAALAALALSRLRSVARIPAALLGAGLAGASALVAMPAVVEVARNPSPPVAAFAALKSDPLLAGRPLVLWEGLAMHLEDLLPGTNAREFRRDKASPVARAELIVTSDDVVFGQKPIRRFAFESPLLSRISRARYLNVSIVEGDPGLGVLRPWLKGKGRFDWTTGNAKLVEGDFLAVLGVVGPVDATMAVEAGARSEARLRLTTDGPIRKLAFLSRERGTLAFRASPDARGVLFRVGADEGDVTLTDFRFTPAPGGAP